MANPGTGYRTVNSLLAEISLHLLEPLCNTQLTVNTAPGVQTPTVGSTVGMYVGALLVVDLYSLNQEIVTITALVPGTSFTATFANSHSSGAVVLTATFPIQQPTDPFFTQSEMLSYLARAQNEFLAMVPSIFQLFQQQVIVNQIYQSTPITCIEIDRIALSNPNVAITSLTRSAGVVTSVTATPHNLSVGSKFAVFGTTGSPLTDSTFQGVFAVATVPDSTHFTYPQPIANSSSTGGFIGLWSRMYEQSQEEIAASHRDWATSFILTPTSWFEDRAGLYRWGTGAKPDSNYPVELLCSIRDSDVLLLTDGFLVPDMLLHYVKYKVLDYAWSKDGVQRNPAMAQYCRQRFDGGVLATNRWLDGLLAPGTATRRLSVSR